MQQFRVSEDNRIVADERLAPRVYSFAEMAITLTEDLKSVEADWNRLADLEKNSLHQGLDWCRNWVEAHGTRLVILRGHIDGRNLFLIPLEIIEDERVKTARFPGSRFNNINTGLFDSDIATPDAEELQNFAHEIRVSLKNTADLVVLDSIPLNWRGVQHPLSGLASVENQNHSFQLPLFPNFEATIAQLNAKTRRKKFRQSMRRFESVGGCEHIVAVETEEKHALLDEFFHQKGHRLRLNGLPDIFSVPTTRDFFHSLLDVPANGEDAPLIVHALRLTGENAGKIAAVSALSRKGGHVICQFSSIDDSICPDASPGELLFWMMIEHSCHMGASIFDFGIGDQMFKRNWCRQETVMHDILIPVTWKGSLMRPFLIAITKTKRAIKRSPRLYALAQRWRSRHQVSQASEND